MPRANAPGYQSISTRSLRHMMLHGPSTVLELSQALGVTPKSIRCALARLYKDGAAKPNDTHRDKVWKATGDKNMYAKRVGQLEDVLILPEAKPDIPDMPSTIMTKRNWFDL